MAKRSRLIKLETYQHRQSGIQARSLNQRVLDKWLHDPQKDIVITVGPAGTGKTLLACDRGMMAFRKGLYEKIIVTRPTVSVDEQLGYLPGDMNEKMEPWTRPIYDVFLAHLKDGELVSQIKNRNIEVCPLAYMRGRTFKNIRLLLGCSLLTQGHQVCSNLVAFAFQIICTGYYWSRRFLWLTNQVLNQ